MKKVICAVCATFIAMSAPAQQVYDCKLSSNPLWSDLLDRSKPAADVSQAVALEAKLRNGEAVSYKKEEPLLVASFRPFRTIPAIVPDIPVRLKNSWMLSPSFNFAAGKPLRFTNEVTLDDGRTFAALWLSDDSVLFIDRDGRFCDKVLNAKAKPVTWTAGTLSYDGPPFVLERKAIKTESSTIGLRIIFTGTSGGQIGFQEVWVSDSTVAKSTPRKFDQFAKAVTIAGLRFELVDVSADQVTVRYDISEKTLMDSAAAYLPNQRN